MSWQRPRIKRLKRTLERVALLSLVVDIAISATTVTSLFVGQSYTVGVIFILNYILTIVVVISLILIGSIVVLSHYHRIPRALSVFTFRH